MRSIYMNLQNVQSHIEDFLPKLTAETNFAYLAFPRFCVFSLQERFSDLIVEMKASHLT